MIEFTEIRGEGEDETAENRIHRASASKRANSIGNSGECQGEMIAARAERTRRA
jgi:hypothetical protein